MNTQYRLLGYRGPRERQFTLLFPAAEKDDQFVPLNAPLIATNRMAVVEADRSRVSEHRFGKTRYPQQPELAKLTHTILGRVLENYTKAHGRLRVKEKLPE